MNNLNYRQILKSEYKNIKKYLFKKNNYGIFIIFYFIFVIISFYPIFKSTDGDIFLSGCIFIVIFFILYLSIGRSYLSLIKRRKAFEKNNIIVCDVLCTDITSYRSHSGNYKHYIYTFIDESGNIMELRNPHFLNGKVDLNDICLILKFNKKYISVFKK